MKEIIIGKNGDQPFPVKGDCVSRKHARITIDDDGRWMLEDLSSANGTFIQDETGEFRQINKVEIDEYTRIALGSTTATGYFFYAHHVLEENNSYEAEMAHVIEVYEQLVAEKQELEERTRKQTMIRQLLPSVISVLVMVVVFFFLPQYKMYVMVVGSMTGLLGTGLAMYQTKNTAAMKAIAEKQSRLVRCPKCNRQLSASEIQNEQCMSCKTHS